MLQGFECEVIKTFAAFLLQEYTSFLQHFCIIITCRRHSLFSLVYGCIRNIFLLYPHTIHGSCHCNESHLQPDSSNSFLLYLTKCFQLFLGCFPNVNWHPLQAFMDIFQGCYKNGTDGTRDYRYFVALVHIQCINPSLFQYLIINATDIGALDL